MNRGYVSEHTQFMDKFLAEHPEAIQERHDGWLIYWDKRVDQSVEEIKAKDTVAQDGYGFYANAWRRRDNKQDETHGPDNP